MSVDKESVKKMFPHLSRELEDEDEQNKVSIDSLRADPEAAELEAQGENALPQEAAPEDKFRHYNPSVVDFIRRCDTKTQAEEIVAYLEKRGEIPVEYACEIRAQLKSKGVRSFGSKKDADYYLKEGGF
ncbi:MAG: DUF2095 domain-containing protein [Candidatus Bathyarchaeota archaeon]|nr:DUF2095 domain-containing protein [Candidatus Bathyarchaeota archaeon]